MWPRGCSPKACVHHVSNAKLLLAATCQSMFINCHLVHKRSLKEKRQFKCRNPCQELVFSLSDRGHIGPSGVQLYNHTLDFFKISSLPINVT